jgi:hypothetical protein
MLQASYWFIGTKDYSQPMAVAIDILDQNDEPIGETMTFDNVPSRVHGAEMVEHYCITQGVSWSQIFYDDDSTQCFERC